MFFGFALCESYFVDSLLAESLRYPLAVVKGPAEEIFIADRKLPGIWRLEEGKKHVYFQAYSRYRSPLNSIRCMAIDSAGIVYSSDTAAREIYRLELPGSAIPLTGGKLRIPSGIAINSLGQIFVADLELETIFELSPSGKLVEFLKTPSPRSIAIDSQDNLWVLSHEGDSVIRFSRDGTSQVIVPGSPFEFANQLVVDENLTVFVSDGAAKTICKIAPEAGPIKLFEGDPLKNPVGLALDGDQLLIADPAKKNVFIAPTDGSSVPVPLLR